MAVTSKLLRMRNIALVSLMVIGSAAVAQPRISSAYTKLDLDRCTKLDRGETPESTEWRCAGYGGIPLFVQNGDERYDVDAGAEDEDALWSNSFDYPGNTVEWRLNRGKPFAIIYRLLPANPEGSRVSTLAVETVGTNRTRGCRIAMIRGSTASANEAARRTADTLLRTPPKCLKPE
jgi:hypothetical protein